MNFFRELYGKFSGLFVWWVIVAPWEQIVRVRLGKHMKVFGGGIHFKIPVLDMIYRQTIRRRVMSTFPQVISTRDRKVITVAGQIAYHIADLKTLYQTLHNAPDVLNGETRAAISEFIMHRKSEEITTEDLQSFVREHIDFDRYGIGGVDFFVTNFAIVRTHRFITGEVTNWPEGDLYTNVAEVAAPLS